MVYYKIIHRHLVSGSYVDRQLNEVSECFVKKGIGQKANTFELRMSTMDPLIEVNDYILIYVSNIPFSTPTDNELIMFGQVKSMSYSHDGSNNKFTIRGCDYSYLVLQQSVPARYKISDAKTAPDIIKAMVRLATYSSSGNGTALIKTDTYVATTRSDNSAFPVISYVSNYKKLYDAIQELSSPEYTGDTKTYIYYIDHNHELHWFHPDNTNVVQQYSINPTSKGLFEYSFEFTNEGIPSTIIVDCGRGLYSGSISTYGLNPFTSQPGTKVLAYREIARDLWLAEIKEGNLIQDDAGSFINTYNTKRYKANTYPLTTTWGVTINDDGEYHSEFNDRARTIAKAKINNIFTSFGVGMWQGSLKFDYTTITAGDIITVSFPEVSTQLSSKKLRVDDVTYVIGKSNYVTISLKEDEKTITP